MEIKTELNNGQLTITPSACLDTAAAVDFNKVMTSALEQSQNILLDMSHVEFISSSAIRTIVVAKKKLDACGGELALSNLNDVVNDVLDMTGLLSVLKII